MRRLRQIIDEVIEAQGFIYWTVNLVVVLATLAAGWCFFRFVHPLL